MPNFKQQWSFVRPTEELETQPGKIAALITQAVEAGVARAVKTKAIPSENEAKIRHIDSVIDFGAGVGGWLTMPLLVVGNQYSCIATAVPAALTPQLANNRVVVFYKVGIETANFPVNLLSFREGVAAGTTYAVFDLEELATCLKPEGYFTEPVSYDPQKVLNIVTTCRVATLAQARVRLGGFIIEPGGAVIS